MKFLKLFFVSIIILFLLITCIGLMFPPQVTVMRSININAPKDSVYAMLSNIDNWKYWLFDSTQTTKILSPRTAGKGAQAQIGGSKITITQTTDTSIESTWDVGKMHSQVADFIITQNSATAETQVTWYFRQHLNWYPWERLTAVLNEKVLGPSMDSSFARLKILLEK